MVEYKFELMDDSAKDEPLRNRLTAIANELGLILIISYKKYGEEPTYKGL